MLRHRIGHEFADPALLVQALAHRSWCAEQATATEPPPPSNERLEYLGDAVLGAIVADHVYQQYPHLLEGRLTDARKAVVNAVALAGVASRLASQNGVPDPMVDIYSALMASTWIASFTSGAKAGVA